MATKEEKETWRNMLEERGYAINGITTGDGDLMTSVYNTLGIQKDNYPVKTQIVAFIQQQQQQQQQPNAKEQVSVPVDKPKFFDEHEATWQEYIELKPKKNDQFSAFLQTISNATVETSEVDPPSWNWPSLEKIGSDKIHVISAKIEATDGAMGEGISLVKLPCSIPIAGMANNGLFVRNEDTGLIKAWTMVQDDGKVCLRSVVLGNPGISKSWHLWKYIVMVANNEVWDAVSDEALSNQPRVLVFVFGSTKEDLLTQVIFLEDRIVHTFTNMGVVSVLNYVAERDIGSVRMLYEPEASITEVPHSSLAHSNIPCTASLSPLLSRYHEFMKRPELRYPFIMQCPSHQELETIIRFFVWLGNGNTQELESQLIQLETRLGVVGPFLRVLIAPEIAYDEYVKKVKAYTMGMPLNTLNPLMYSIEAEEATFSETTHRCARFITPKAAEGNFVSNYLVPSSTIVLSRLRDQLDHLTTDAQRLMVMQYEKEVNCDMDNPKALESLTKSYIMSTEGLLWTYAVCQMSLKKRTDKTKEQFMKRPLKKTTTSTNRAPKAREMKPDILYQPKDANYPFVDQLWVDEEISTKTYNNENSKLPPILSSQCSVSATHPKELFVYNKLRASLEMPERQLLIVYMTTIPRSVKGYLVGPRSAFFAYGKSKKRKTASGGDFEWPPNVEFRVFFPNKDMHNKQAESDEYGSGV